MPCNPHDVICEILGQPAAGMTDPSSEHYLCRFRSALCSKRSHRLDGPFPVCSVFRQRKGEEKTPIAVCPRRLYAADIYNDVIQHCWPGEAPVNPIVVHEIKMGAVGNVDMVIAEPAEDGKSIKNFVSIELQAVDITGTYEPAYTSILTGAPLDKRPKYSFNYKNVQKRFVAQLIDKGFFHHHWGTKIIGVVQDSIYDNLKKRINFPEVSIEHSNIIFMQYGMVLTETPAGPHYDLQLKGVAGTTHSELMMSSLYQKTPPREEFCSRILKVYNAGQ